MFGRSKRPVVDPTLAAAALEQTRNGMNRARANRPFVEQLRADLVAARQQNNFAARIRASWGEAR